jgi:hypothetical protein
MIKAFLTALQYARRVLGAYVLPSKAVLLVVIGYRHKGGVSKTRVGEILGLEAAPYLEDLCKKELVYTAPGKELNRWRPTPEALLALGLLLRYSRTQGARTLL